MCISKCAQTSKNRSWATDIHEKVVHILLVTLALTLTLSSKLYRADIILNDALDSFISPEFEFVFFNFVLAISHIFQCISFY